MFGCMRRVIVLVLILLVLAVAYIFRGSLKQKWQNVRGGDDAAVEVVSEELATSAFTKIEDLRESKTERAAFSTNELQSLVQYKYMGALPAFASQPKVAMAGDRMTLKVRVPVDRIPNIKGLGDVASFLPDTADVQLTGTLIPLPNERVALGVDAVQAAGIPLPERMIKEVLQKVGRRDEPGLPADAIAVTLPTGVRAAYIRNDSLILLSRPGN